MLSRFNCAKPLVIACKRYAEEIDVAVVAGNGEFSPLGSLRTLSQLNGNITIVNYCDVNVDPHSPRFDKAALAEAVRGATQRSGNTDPPAP